MKLWRAYLLSALLFVPLSLKADFASFNQFSGLNTDDSPLLLKDGQTPDSENVITDDGPGIQGRKGFVSFSTQVAVAMWEFPKSDGTRYLIANTGSRLLADVGAGTFSTVVSTVPSDRTVAGSVLGDRFYFADTLNGLKYWDGSSVFIATAALKVDKLVTWKGRLVAAGFTAAQRQISLSKLNDGTSWTAPANPSDDDAATITVSGALDENIQGLFSSFKDLLIWFKKNSFGGIYGSRRSNFSQRTFSDYVGLASAETIRDCDGYLRWLGNNRVIWEFDGANYKKISEQVDNLFAPIAQGDSSAKSNTQTTQTQFELGTQSPSGFADTSTTPGTLTPKTTTFLDTTQADFQGGTCDPTDSCDTTLLADSLSAKITTTTWTDATDWGAGTFDTTLYADTQTVSGNLQTTFPETCSSIRDGSSSTKKVWDSQGYGTVTPTVSGGACIYTSTRTQFIHLDRTITIGSGTTFYFQLNNLAAGTGGLESFFGITDRLFDLTDPFERIFDLSTPGKTNDHYFFIGFIATTTAAGFECNQARYKNAGSGTATGITLSPSNGIDSGSANYHSAFPGNCMLFINSSVYAIYFNGVLLSSGTHSFTSTGSFYVYFQAGANIAGSTDFKYDDFTIAPQTFTFTSAGKNTGLNSPIWANFYASTSGAGTFTYTSQASSDNSSFDTAQTATIGSALTSAQKRYMRISATVSYSSSTTLPGLPASIASFSTPAYATMTFTSHAFDTGMTLPKWGVVNVSSTAAVLSVNGSTATGGTSTSYYSQTSADGVTWDSRVAMTQGSQIGSSNKRYIRYVANSTPTANGGYDQINAFTTTGKSTGTFTSQAVQIGTLITAWGTLTVSGDVTGGGSFTVGMATSTDGITFSTFTTITNNTVPNLPTAPYMKTRVIFSVVSATETPNITDIVINWTEGSSIRSASAYINQRYWLGVSVSSTANNRVFVYDKNRQWQRYTNINMDATTLYNSKLYFGNSTGIYQAENGYSDNGASIASYFRSATVALGGLDAYVKFDHLYTATDASDSVLTTTFQVEGVNTDYTLGSQAMNATTGIQNLKFPFAVSEIQQGRLISLKWRIPGTAFWRILNSNLYYDRDPLPY